MNTRFVELLDRTKQVRKQTEQIYLLREREQEMALQETAAAEVIALKAGELERSNAELKEFAYLTSHDLQEPLRTIRSFSDLLQKEYLGQLSVSAGDYLEFL